jgi:very-short-patch-repair endonuclease
MPRDWRSATTSSSQRAKRHKREREILAQAARQHGIVSHAQLAVHGLSDSAIRSRVSACRLHRIHRGVYAVGRADLTTKGHWLAAVLACGERALLSHRAAAALHELLRPVGGPIDVVVMPDQARSRRAIRIHRSACVTDADRAELEGIPCTSVPRTLLDLAATAPLHLLARACNQAERIGTLDMHAIEELLGRRAGQPGVSRLWAALREGQVGEGIPETELERRFLALCRRARVPRPSVNEWMAIAGEEMQCDFVWHRERVVVEVDGWESHRTRRAFEEDRRRDRILRLAGWQVARFTWHDVTATPADVRRVVRGLVLAA